MLLAAPSITSLSRYTANTVSHKSELRTPPTVDDNDGRSSDEAISNIFEVFPNPSDLTFDKLPFIYAVIFNEQAKDAGITLDEMLALARIGLIAVRNKGVESKERTVLDLVIFISSQI